MKQNNITWTQIFQWWPILGFLIVMTLSYATLITRIAVVENKIDNMLTLLKNHEDRNDKILANLNDLNKRVITLETEHALNRR